MNIHGTRQINDTKLHSLLERWNSHQDLRSTGAPIHELGASRIRLDHARTSLRTAA